MACVQEAALLWSLHTFKGKTGQCKPRCTAVTNWVKGSGLRLQRPFARSEPGEQETLQGRKPGTQELTGKQTDQLRTRDKECGTVQPARKFTYLTLAQVQGGT